MLTINQLTSDLAVMQALASVGQPVRVVIHGDPQELERTGMVRKYRQLPRADWRETIAEAENLDIVNWFAAQKQERLEGMEANGLGFAELWGEWPGAKPMTGLSLARIWDWDGRQWLTNPDIAVSEIAVSHSWQILPFLNFGNSNWNPPPAAHGAVWRYWQRKYDAHVVGCSYDVVNAYVKSPPRTIAAAQALAIEQFYYCDDLVYSTYDTFNNLAASLMDSNYWRFWWD